MEGEEGFSAADIAADWNSASETDVLQPEKQSAADAPGTAKAAEWPDSESAATGVKTGTAAVGREADRSFTLKHLGAVKTVGRDEIVTLAQKGLDYDRQRQRNDELFSRNKALSAEAERLRVQKGGTPALTRQEAETLRRDREIGEFLAEYRNLDPKNIPKEVWQAVTAGRPLLASYQAWELKKLRTESSATQKAAENRVKSAGSRTSAGSERYMDAITADWYSN